VIRTWWNSRNRTPKPAQPDTPQFGVLPHIVAQPLNQPRMVSLSPHGVRRRRLCNALKELGLKVNPHSVGFTGNCRIGFDLAEPRST
jgi:hypothetical protein